MVTRRAGLAGLVMIVAGIAAAGSASAGARVLLNAPFGSSYDDDYYYSEPYFVPAPRYYYYRPRLRPRPRYYAYQYEPDYYEPEVAPNYGAPPNNRIYVPPSSSRKTTNLPQQKSSTKTPAKQSAGITCEKASKIVSDYGFTQVKATSCTGKIYAFNAQRDGKPFMVKLSSASGELTEVKKQ